MDPERWKQVRQLLERVLERPRSERAASLDEACAGDLSLRREVESLAEAHDEAGSFIEHPAVDLGEPDAAPLAPGTTLGRFVVLSLVGRGGMGIVYAAYDPRLDRRVALKLLRRPALGDSGLEERLLREAQALARLSHPNVIAVYDVGSIDGRVFIAMELVTGETLDTWIRATARDWRTVLVAFQQAGRGLEAAHAAGLVHRDFKPGNVLVGGDRVVVVDFGLARAHDRGPAETSDGDARPSNTAILEHTLTQTGTLLGTPAYMAPEQRAGGTTSVAADQFSFCVAFYEALYGQRPFADGMASNAPRDPPSGSGVPGWLHKVLARGLRADPAQRFSSMTTLLQALGRDPRRAQRRWLLAAGAVAALAGGVIVARSPARRGALLCAGAEQRLAGVWDDTRRTALDQAFLATGAPFAEDARRRVRTTLDTYAGEWTRLRTDTCEATHVRGEQSADLLDRRMACLDQSLQELRALAGALTRADAAHVEGAVKTASSLTPLALCSDTPALLAQLRAPADEATRIEVEDLRRRVAEAKAAEDLGDYDRGLVIAVAAASDAEAVGYWPVTAEALLRLGALQEAQVKRDEAAASLHRALLAAQSGRHDRVAVEAFTRLVRVEGSFHANRPAGHRYAAHARALLETLRERGDLEAALATNVGKLWFDAADYTRALDEYRRALALRRVTFGPEHPQVAETLSLLGHVHLARGEQREALAQFEQARAATEKALGPAHPKVAVALDETGRVLHQLGDRPAALERHQRALALLEAAVGSEHRLVATVLVNLGNSEAALGRPAEALRAHARAQQILERTLGADHPKVALALTGVGNALVDSGEPRRALAPYRRALALQEAAYGPRHPAVASTLFNLGEAYKDSGEPAKALHHYRKALAIWDAAFDEDHYLQAYGLTGLGEALIDLRRTSEAVPPLERALDISERRALEPRATGGTQFALARALRAVGGHSIRAQELAARALVALRTAGPAAERERREVEAWLRAQSGGM